MKCLIYSSFLVACILTSNQVAGAPNWGAVRSDTGVFVRDIMDSLSVYLTGLFSSVGNMANSYIAPDHRRTSVINKPAYFHPIPNKFDLRSNQLSPNNQGHGSVGSSNIQVDAPFSSVGVQDNNGNSRVRVRAPFANVDVRKNFDHDKVPNVKEHSGNGYVRAPLTDVNVKKGNGVHVRAPFTDLNVKKGNGVQVRAPFTDVNVKKGNGVQVRAPFTDVNVKKGNGVQVRSPLADVNVKKGNGVQVKAPFTDVNVEKGNGVQVRAPFTYVDRTHGVNIRAPFVDVRVVDGATRVVAPFTDLFLQYRK